MTLCDVAAPLSSWEDVVNEGLAEELEEESF
jgi:hypothetical protein